MHGRDSALQHPGDSSGRVAESELPDQFGMPKVHGLLIAQHLGGIDIKPVAPVDAELQRQPVRQIDQALILDANTGDVVGETVVQTGGIGSRVVQRSCIGLGRTPAGGPLPIADRAQRLAQFLLLRDVTPEGECPRAASVLAVDI